MTELPNTPGELLQWSRPDIEPHYRDLAAQPLATGTLESWLAAWSRLAERVSEMEKRLFVATTVDTADAQATARYSAFMDEIYPPSRSAEQQLREKLLASGLRPAGFDIPLRNMQASSALYREVNLPLLAQEQKLYIGHDAITGAQTVTWQGRQVTLPELQALSQAALRPEREQAWRLARARQLADRAAIDEQWGRVLRLRLQIAANAGFGDDYRAFRWQQSLRFDYSPADCASFGEAIEAVAVPAAARIYDQGRRRLGVATLRPWDLGDGWWGRPLDQSGRSVLRPFTSAGELERKLSEIFTRLDPPLGGYFDTMRREGLLDVESRPNKAPGAYCDDFDASGRAFILANVVGTHDDVQTMLHEAGHAFHQFERGRLPYYHQRQVGFEFGEVASMSMELLAAPYLAAGQGGFYSQADAARARVGHLENAILFWPFMAVVDGFQHWAYQNPEAALDPSACDARWTELWRRFVPGVDWTGLDLEMATGWHRKPHIHQMPFYYVEYGLAQLGAAQIWRNALADQSGAVAAYRDALALGGTRSLPDLFSAAGARFAFDAATLRDAVGLMEDTIADLDSDTH